MTSFLYAINIGTLATWLSVAGFGTVGIVIPVTQELIAMSEPDDPYKDLESTVLTDAFTGPELMPSEETDEGDSGEANEETPPLAEQETLPAPPEMPEVTETTPLPEIPDLPAPARAETPAPKPTTKPPTRSNLPTNRTGATTKGKEDAKGKAGNGGQNGGSGMSDAKRLAGGRMPPPSYPSEARSKGQTGTIIVEFVVDESGRVVSAYAKSTSPWPLLNESALRAVRRWKFPPGKVTKYVRPIVFKLN